MVFLSLTFQICVARHKMSNSQLLQCQAQPSLSHLDSHIRPRLTMPSRQQVLEALRTISEEVLESLRILLFMIFTMTKAVPPDEEMQESEMNPINQLVNEVRSQKAKISELGYLITNKLLDQPQSSGPQPSSPPLSQTTALESWEIAELEAAGMEGSFHQEVPSQAAPGPSTFQPTSRTMMSSPAPQATNKPSPKIAGISTRGPPLVTNQGRSTTSAILPESNNQLSMTQAALDAWGQKVIGWGKKHMGDTYQVAYDTDSGYTKWILSRINSLSEDLEDYGNYCLTRRRLEEAALRHVSR
jgi:hypothetical protein